jgi:RNA polymerase sigma factor (sigma-70 family)
MKDYRVKITVRNDRILSKIESEYVSVRNFCMAMNLEYQRITDLIRGTSPINAKGEIKELVKKLMEALGCTIEELFTEKQLKGFVSHNKFETKVDEKDLMKIKQDIKPLELGMMEQDVTKVLNKIFHKFLTPREERVIRMRFGIGTWSDATLAEVGLQFEVTQERIRHIEQNAMKKLSSPEVIDELRNAGIQDIFSKVDIKGPLIKKREEKRLQKINVFKQMLKEDKEKYEINELDKYKNITIDNETYNIITELQTVMSSQSKLSRSQIIKTLVEEKERNIN